jgi:hypothetical protein
MPPHKLQACLHHKRLIACYLVHYANNTLAMFLLSIADKLAAAGVEPMSMEEIVAEVNAVRAARRASAR